MKHIFKHISGLLVLLGGVMLLPSVVAAGYGEWYSMAGFIFSAVLVAGIGYAGYKGIRQTDPLQLKDAFVAAAAGWLLIAIAGAIPYMVIAQITPSDVAAGMVPAGADFGSSLVYFYNPLHALFESMSAFTTTGLTMAVHEPTIGKGLLFYRSLSQWVGGGGFIVLSIAYLSHLRDSDRKLMFGAESAEIMVRANIIQTVRSIWKVYLGVTLFSFLYLVIGTFIILPDYGIEATLFDSLNHAMAGQSTGGFSTLDDSIAGYHSQAMEILYLLPMVLGAFSLPFFYKLIHLRKWKLFWEDRQTRGLLFAFIGGSLALSGSLALASSVSEPFRQGIFQYVSAISTTGWQTSDFTQWPEASVLLIVLTAMIIGGAAGATVGGIKIIRIQAIFSAIRYRIRILTMPPNAVVHGMLAGEKIATKDYDRRVIEIMTFVLLFGLFLIAGTWVTIYCSGEGFRITDAFFESVSAQATVGLSTGITTPEMSPITESWYIFQMWIGRLEIFPVILLIRAIGTKLIPLKRAV